MRQTDTHCMLSGLVCRIPMYPKSVLFSGADFGGFPPRLP
jgi:hypothetical protein